MTLQEILLLVLEISLGLNIFAVGLRATFNDGTYVLRRPTKLLPALLSMFVLVPGVAVALALTFDLNPAVKIALVFLSISPIPPVLPNKVLKAGGHENYAVGLLVATSLLAIVVIPIAMALFERVFGLPLQMSPGVIANLVFTSLLLPLTAGMVLHAMAPAFAERAAGPVAFTATVLLIIAFLPILFAIREPLLSLIGDGTLLAVAVFTLVGLVIGHLLGGPVTGHRIVLALYSSSRHPAIAIAMAQANFPQEKLAVMAVSMTLLVGGLVSTIYLAWMKGHSSAAPPVTGWRAKI